MRPKQLARLKLSLTNLSLRGKYKVQDALANEGSKKYIFIQQEVEEKRLGLKHFRGFEARASMQRVAWPKVQSLDIWVIHLLVGAGFEKKTLKYIYYDLWTLIYIFTKKSPIVTASWWWPLNRLGPCHLGAQPLKEACNKNTTIIKHYF